MIIQQATILYLKLKDNLINIDIDNSEWISKMDKDTVSERLLRADSDSDPRSVLGRS